MARNTATGRSIASGNILSQCLLFDGISNLVTIPDSSNYSQPTTGELSISFWINPDDVVFPNEEGSGGDRYVGLLSKEGNNKNEWEFRMYGSDNTVNRANRISFYMFALAGGLGDGVAFQETVVPGQWIHIVGTIDSTKTLRMYKNGVLKDTFQTSLTLSDTASPIRIGATASNSDTATSFFKGKFGEVRIYSRALKDLEVSDLFKSNRVNTQGLVGWFKLNEGSGSVAVDSVNGNNGVISGANYATSFLRNRILLSPDVTFRSSTLIANTVPNRRLKVRQTAYGNSLYFNGTATDFATDATYILPTSAFTISLWVRAQAFANNARVLDQQDSGPANGATINSVINQGSNLLNFTIRNSGSNVASLSTDSLIPLKWYHLVCVYSVDNVKLYLNGILQQKDTSATMTTPTALFNIGRRAGGGNPFNGNISQIIIFPSALSETKTQALYFEGALPDDSSDMFYTLDNNSTDTSGNSRVLGITGTAFQSETPFAVRLSA